VFEFDGLPPLLAERPGLRPAVEWAARMHRRQRREVDAAPFILHPLEVATLLTGRDLDDAVIVAGVLHDVVENTGATIAEVRRRFGGRVAKIVAAVTEDGEIDDYARRKAALCEQMAGSGPDAHAVYAADKIAKARELRAEVAGGRAALDDPHVRRRIEHYEHSLATLRGVAGGQPLVDQLAFELWALRALPPHAVDEGPAPTGQPPQVTERPAGLVS
jgi:hypothetical protein